MNVHFQIDDSTALRLSSHGERSRFRSRRRPRWAVSSVRAQFDAMAGQAGAVDKCCRVENKIHGAPAVAMPGAARSWHDARENVAPLVRTRVVAVLRPQLLLVVASRPQLRRQRRTTTPVVLRDRPKGVS